MNSTLIKRSSALIFVALFSTGPLLLFVGSAHASGTSPYKSTPYQTTRKNAGTPNSSVVKTNSNGVVISYGNSAITYNAPSPALATLGQALFEQNCASCHGTEANGVPANGTSGAYPNLVGLGPATIDFWIESGRMPAADPRSVQASRRVARLNHQQALAVAAWVNSLSPSYPGIPTPNLKIANVADGAALFALNCAACHTIEGDGDALAHSTFAPSLRNIPAFQVVEAIRTGPGNMPRFTGNLSDYQVNDIVKYVTAYIQHPQNPGGFGLGGLGPVAEGFVGLALGVGLLALVGFWVGERQ
ncbi:MAG: c-type cytochrome [Acidimicrobiaceae bacterium]|nr:c-type cytochrome [Acidimicrobiaceae bacterium]